MNIIPKINGELNYLDNSINIGNPVFNFIDSSLSLSSDTLELFLKRIKSYKNENDRTPIKVILDNSFKNQEYKLRLSQDEIKLIVSNNEGLGYGLTSLYHLIKEQNNIKCMSFNDYPKYNFREFMLDSARNYISVDEIKKIIEQAALMKLNIFHWHLTDDQGWRIESKTFPMLNEIGGKTGYYTQKEIKDIVEYARIRGIEVIPEIDLPGHSTALLASYHNLSCDKGTYDIKTGYVPIKNALCVTQKETYDFIYKLLDEIMPLFPSQYFHIGGDEVSRDNWIECPNCREFMKKNNLPTTWHLQGHFINQISEYLSNNGKQAICWNDCSKAPNLNKNIILQFWFDFPFDKTTLNRFNNNQTFIASSYFNTYFNNPYCLVPLMSTYNFVPEIRKQELSGNNLLGTSCHLWAEEIDNNELLEQLLFPRLQTFAENAWSNKLDYQDFLRRINLYLKELEKEEIKYASIEESTITGKDASKEIVKYFKDRTGMVSSDYIPSKYLLLVGAKTILGLLRNNQSVPEIASDILHILQKK